MRDYQGSGVPGSGFTVSAKSDGFYGSRIRVWGVQAGSEATRVVDDPTIL